MPHISPHSPASVELDTPGVSPYYNEALRPIGDYMRTAIRELVANLGDRALAEEVEQHLADEPILPGPHAMQLIAARHPDSSHRVCECMVELQHAQLEAEKFHSHAARRISPTLDLLCQTTFTAISLGESFTRLLRDKIHLTS